MTLTDAQRAWVRIFPLPGTNELGLQRMLSLTAFLSSPGTRKEVYLSSLFPWQLRSSPQLQHPRHSLVPYLSGRSRVVSLHGNGLTATSGRGGVEEAPHRGCVEERMGLSSHVVTGKAFQIFILFFFLFFPPDRGIMHLYTNHTRWWKQERKMWIITQELKTLLYLWDFPLLPSRNNGNFSAMAENIYEIQSLLPRLCSISWARKLNVVFKKKKI